MKKLLTISIAAYNVENYIEETLDSLICKNMDKLEVLIINDGSKDNTEKIAKKYEKKYPQVFKVITKPNGGYGSTINKGIELANGKYFKQLDGDDKYDTKNLDILLEKLNDLDTDIIYNPYYSWTDKEIKTVYCGIEKEDNKNVDLNYYLKNFRNDIVMHSLAYKTSILKKNKIKILENSFYTDSEYALYPFMYSKTIKVFNFPLYVYRIGNIGQSVSIVGMRKHSEDFNKVINSILKNTKKLKLSLDNEIEKYILYKTQNIFCISISNLILALPFSYKSYKYIKSIDLNIKKQNKNLYVCFKEHKTVNYFRKGKFLTYALLHMFLRLRLKFDRGE